MNRNTSWVCQKNNGISKSIFLGDDPLKYPTTLLFVQLSTAALTTAILQLFLTPLGESAFFSQMLAGILLGPTFWGVRSPIVAIFHRKSHYVGQTYALFGCLIFLFLVGVKTDLSMIKRTGKKAVIIGILSFVLPISINSVVAAIINLKFAMDPELRRSVHFIAAFLSLSSFHVVVCLLDDLKLLNSELGRLATSSSLISGMCSLSWAIITTTIMNPKEAVIWMFVSLAALVIVIMFIMRPVMIWMVRQTSEGKPMKESHIWGVFMMILACAFFSELFGQHMIIGPMILGMATPEGPPLGSALVTKLDSYVSSILLPSYFLMSCSGINIRNIQVYTVCIILVLSFCNFIAKFLATFLPSLLCKMPPLDAVSLALIMTSQGITDVLLLQEALLLMLIDSESFTIMTLSMVIITGITTPVVKFLYAPSRRYISHKRRTIQHAHPDSELRMLAGIYSEYQTPTIINLLELSNPTARRPICFYVVHLLELTGRSAPLLITHRPDRRNSFRSHGSQHMINAFRLYEQDNEGLVVNIFTAVAPYATMHEEVCSLAMHKRVSMVIVPFHKQWQETAQMEELPKSIRSVNQNIIRDAPCSVGILIDRGTLSGTSCMSSKSLYRIGMIFVEGPDDREALAYAMRMGEHPNVSITVIRLIDSNRQKTKEISGVSNIHLAKDDRIINDFKIAQVGKKNYVYKEEMVSDSVETVAVIRNMENTYDVILVGRRHDNNSALFMGLTEWNEFPELGFFGDMLASSDSPCQVSVLVVQQQTQQHCKKHGSSNHLRDFDFDFDFDSDSSVPVDIPLPPRSRNNNKVWPV